MNQLEANGSLQSNILSTVELGILRLLKCLEKNKKPRCLNLGQGLAGQLTSAFLNIVSLQTNPQKVKVYFPKISGGQPYIWYRNEKDKVTILNKTHNFIDAILSKNNVEFRKGSDPEDMTPSAY